MNNTIAEETLEDHRYLLIDVQNRAAIAYFAAANRNLSLYEALKDDICKTLVDELSSDDEDEIDYDDNGHKRKISKEDEEKLTKEELRIIRIK